MMGTDVMGTTDEALGRAHALAQTEEPTAEMIAASEAEVAEPSFVALAASEELSGGAGAMYLREIANHELLTQQEEVKLAQRMEAARAAAARLAPGAEFSPGEREQLEKLVADGENAR